MCFFKLSKRASLLSGRHLIDMNTIDLENERLKMTKECQPHVNQIIVSQKRTWKVNTQMQYYRTSKSEFSCISEDGYADNGEKK